MLKMGNHDTTGQRLDLVTSEICAGWNLCARLAVSRTMSCGFQIRKVARLSSSLHGGEDSQTAVEMLVAKCKREL
jgi:hypothetical protein